MELFYREVQIESIQEFVGVFHLYSSYVDNGSFEEMTCSEIIDYLFLDGSYASFKLGEDVYTFASRIYCKVQAIEDDSLVVGTQWSIIFKDMLSELSLSTEIVSAATNAYCRRVLASFNGRSLNTVLTKNYYSWFEEDPFIQYLRKVGYG